VVIAALLLTGVACRSDTVEVGFWFEPVRFESPRLGGSITAEDLALIEHLARRELTHAFSGLRVTFSGRRDARYRLNVVQELQDPRFSRPIGGAGQSRALGGFGGWGSVSFYFLANGAIAYAPPGANRGEIVAAIGRGIGRTAAHELTHQLLPTAPIHASTNVRSYEYATAARREHYYGDMEWDAALPLLEKRIRLSSLLRGETNASSAH
jgi:hypothetical protein